MTLVLEDAGRPGSFGFRPGQFFTLVTDIDGRPVRRAYSASSAPGAPRLEVTVKHVEGGAHQLGSVVVEPGQTLLDAGLAAGLPMPYSCTVGNCGDCTVSLRGGESR
jgi:ferredoxin-NADP reductase